MPKISIGLPVYNGEDFLSDAIESILAQTYRDFELIISDNGSTDDTETICERFAAKDDRVHYVRSAVNRGAAWNYNHAFDLASGQYFKWAAHDDLIESSYLERLLPIMEDNPDIVVCYPRSVLVDEQNRPIRRIDDKLHRCQDRPSDRIRNYNPGLCHPVFGIVRANALAASDRIGCYPASDRTLLFQLLLAGKFYEVPEHLFRRRTHDKSSVRNNPDFKSRMRWFGAKRTNFVYLPTWHQVYKYVSAIAHAAIDRQERVRCYGVIARRYLGHPKWMANDFVIAARELMGTSPMRTRRDLV